MSLLLLFRRPHTAPGTNCCHDSTSELPRQCDIVALWHCDAARDGVPSRADDSTGMTWLLCGIRWAGCPHAPSRSKRTAARCSPTRPSGAPHLAQDPRASTTRSSSPYSGHATRQSLEIYSHLALATPSSATTTSSATSPSDQRDHARLGVSYQRPYAAGPTAGRRATLHSPPEPATMLPVIGLKQPQAYLAP